MKSMKGKGIFLRNKKTIVPSGAQKTLECGVRDHEEADCLCPPLNLIIVIVVIVGISRLSNIVFKIIITNNDKEWVHPHFKGTGVQNLTQKTL